MTRKTRIVMDRGDFFKLCQYVQENHETFNDRKYSDVATEAEAALGFDVRDRDIINAADTAGVTWRNSRARPVSARSPSSQLRTVARAVALLVNQLDAELSPNLRKTLFEIAHYGDPKNTE